MRIRIILGLAAIWLSVAGFAAAQNRDDLKIPPEEAKKENPVQPDESSVADGRHIYKFDCAMCHGEAGDGKTPLADSMKLELEDLRDPALLKDYTDGALAFLILKGKGKMPGEEGRLKKNQVWHLVNYIRSLAKKGPPPAAEKPK